MRGNQSYQSRACLPTLFLVLVKIDTIGKFFSQFFAVFNFPVLRNTICWYSWYVVL